MVAPGSVHARRAALPAFLAPVAVVLGVLAMRAGVGALAGLGLGLRLTLLVCELLLVVPGLLLVALSRAPLAGALAPLPLPGRSVLLSLSAGITLWGASLGLFALQYLAWPPPDGYLEAFRQLHAALLPSGPADALFSITAIALVPAVCEETLFRGIVFSSLCAAMGAGRVVFLQAFLFALIHIDPAPGGTLVAYRVPFAFGVGLALGMLRLRTGSLAASALAHALLNAVTFVVVLLAEDPARETDPGALLGLALLVGGTVGTLLLLRALPATASPPASREGGD
jgi:membrane protease YdiL (CAAX protease family)